jgi:class 3 adenylate cyclase
MTAADELEVRYARVPGGTHAAYAVVGAGDRDIVWLGDGIATFEDLVEQSISMRWSEVLRRLGRLILVDLPGIGLSDPLPAGSTVADRAEGLLAVIDATGAVRVDIVAVWIACDVGLAFAAAHPERVDRLAIYGPAPPIPESELDGIEKLWGTGRWSTAGAAPGRLSDPSFLRMMARRERGGGSPTAVRSVLELHDRTRSMIDLSAIAVPTLVLERAEYLGFSDRRGPDLAAGIPGARYVPLEADLTWERFDDIADEVTSFLVGGHAPHFDERPLQAILFTDIVSSTSRAGELGDRQWKQLLDEHDRTVRRVVESNRGRVVKSTGDGALAVFGSPSCALRCAHAIHAALGTLGIEVRAGLHVGELEVRGDDVGGVAVHLAARVGALADAGEVLVTDTVAAVVAGSGVRFEPAGEHHLKGLPGQWRVMRSLGV